MFSSSYVMLQEFSYVVKCSLKVLCSINSMKHNNKQNGTGVMGFNFGKICLLSLLNTSLLKRDL